MNTNWMFTVLHIHFGVSHPPTHSTLVTCSIFFPMAAKALQTLSLLPVTVTSLHKWPKEHSHHRSPQSTKRSLQTSDMYKQTDHQIKVITEHRLSWKVHHMDLHTTYHHGHTSPWKQTWWITMETTDIIMEQCRSLPRAYRATKGRWPYPSISCGSISTWHVRTHSGALQVKSF